MENLIAASREPTVQALINRLFELDTVIGFAIRPHQRFISLARGAFGRDLSTETILSIGKSPDGWDDECRQSGYPSLRPLYVAIYVEGDADTFERENSVPPVTETGYLIVVETTEPFVGLADRSRHSPLQGGISAAGHDPTSPGASGTLGGFLEDTKTKDIYLVSCEHVLGAVATDVLQQSNGDGGKLPADKVAQTSCIGGLTTSFPAGTTTFNTVDTAMAKLATTRTVKGQIRMVGPINGFIARKYTDVDDDVVFVGKESDFQQARITGLIARIKVTIDGVRYTFSDVFQIEPRTYQYVGTLAKEGDSGAWVIREEGKSMDKVCGLLFSGNGKTALCCHFESAIQTLEAESGCQLRIHT